MHHALHVLDASDWGFNKFIKKRAA